MVRLLVAEKPSLAKTISAALKIPVAGRDGSIPAGAAACVIHLVGHVMEPVDPDDYDPIWKGWAFSTLPILPESFRVAPVKSSMDVYKAALKAMKAPEVTEIVNACDPAREGELIFGLVYEAAKVKKPAFRLWPKDLTDESLREAWKAMKSWADYKGLYDAAKCRQESDWLLGMNATRAQTLAMQSHGVKGVFSIGRVQTPTLAILVKRELEIKNFVPKAFWTVVGTFGAAAGDYKGNWFAKGRDRFENEADAQALAARLKGKPARVASVETKDQKKCPEPFYDLSNLQQACNRRFGLTAEQTLGIAQALYEEKKVLSYPRTNSRHLTDTEEAKLPELLRAMKAWDEFRPIVEEIEKMGVLGKKLGKKFVDSSKVEDHSALLPTGKKASLDPMEARVFGLVVRRLLAAYFPDRVEAKTTLITEVLGEPLETFKTTGTVVKEEGWSRIDPTRGSGKAAGAGKGKGKAKDDEDEEESEDGEEQGNLPRVAKAEAVENRAIEPKRGETKPPKPLTEADLLKAMENAGNLIDDEDLAEAMKDKGLGTAATRAGIIETLVAREYVKRVKKVLQPQAKGINLIQAIKIPALKSPSLTGEWEEKMNRMARGDYARADFMAEIHGFVKKIISEFKGQANAAGLDASGASGRGGALPAADAKAADCPKCGSPMVLKTWEGRIYASCTGTKDKSCKTNYDTDEHGKPKRTCDQAGCGGPVKEGVSKNSKKPFAICCKCGEFQGGNGGSAGGPVFKAEKIGHCKKCKKGAIMHKAFEGRHYAQCDHDGCKLSYDLTPDGSPSGACKFCGEYTATTRSGNARCNFCDQWQKRPSGKRSAGKKSFARSR